MMNIYDIKNKYDNELRDFILDMMRRFNNETGLSMCGFDIEVIDTTIFEELSEGKKSTRLGVCKAHVEL